MPYTIRPNTSMVVDEQIIYKSSYTTLSGTLIEFALVVRLHDDNTIDILNTKTGSSSGFLPAEAAANLMKFLIKKMPLEALGEL